MEKVRAAVGLLTHIVQGLWKEFKSLWKGFKGLCKGFKGRFTHAYCHIYWTRTEGNAEAEPIP